jgi:hypothetical protein
LILRVHIDADEGRLLFIDYRNSRLGKKYRLEKKK